MSGIKFTEKILCELEMSTENRRIAQKKYIFAPDAVIPPFLLISM